MLVRFARRISDFGSLRKSRTRLTFKFIAAAHRQQLDSFTVNPEIERMWFGEPADVIAGIPLQEYSDRVLSVRRKIMPNGDSSAGPEWQIVAHAVVLREELGKFVFLRERTCLWFSHSHAADDARRGQVPFQ